MISRSWAEHFAPDLIRCWPEKSCTSVCRPEDLVIADTKGPFIVRSSTRIGDSRLYQLCCGNQRVSVLSQRILPEGAAVQLAPVPERVCFYDESGTLLDADEV